MQTVQLFHADGRLRYKGPNREIVTGTILSKRLSRIDVKDGLVVADIILVDSPGDGLSHHVTAFIKGSV